MVKLGTTQSRASLRPSDLYKIMREHGFSVAVIKAMMGEAYPTGIEATETLDPKNTDIDYLALANPRYANSHQT